MPRITIDARMINSSGIGTYIRNIVSRLIVNKKYYFSIIGVPSELHVYSWSTLPNVEIIECRAQIYSISEQILIPLLIPRSTDLLWVPHYNIPILYNGKMLVTIHDLFHLSMKQFVHGMVKTSYAKVMFNLVARRSVMINTISNFSKEELIRFTNVENNKVHITPLGVGEEWHPAQFATRLHPRPYFVCVGNVKPHKNIKTAIQAFSKIKDRFSVDLVIIGQKEGFIVSDNISLGDLSVDLSERIIFTGYINQEALIQYVSQAEALLFPSLYEGFGLPPVEAMACGCPVIASNVASIPEVCGDAVLYCNPYDSLDIADKMTTMLSDVSLREDLIARGKKRVRNYSWDKCVGELTTLIDEVIV